MKPAPFEYHAPGSAAEAVEMLSELGEGAKVLSGGQSLVPMLALRLTFFDHLIDIGRAGDLRGIEVTGDQVRIGATTTQSAVERSSDVASLVPLMAEATPLIGHIQIRNRGTLGGSLAHADPAAEYPAVALALDAQLEARSATGRRTIPATEFFKATWTTVLRDDELLTAAVFPVWPGRTGFALREIARRHGDFAIAGAAVAMELGGNEVIRRCNIGLFGMGPTPLRAPSAEAALEGMELANVDIAEIGRLAVASAEDVPSDIYGSATYRLRVGAAMVGRALEAAGEGARRA